MATLTTKLGLRKPDPADNVSVVTDLNDNFDKIDTAFSNFLTGAYKNVIRNGDMQVRQRGIGPFTAAGYTVDGWVKGHSGGTQQVDAIVESLESVGGINGSPASLRSTVAGQAAATDYAEIQQKVEGVRTLSGKQVTLSFIAYASAGTPKIGIEVQQNFATGGAPSADVFTSISAVTISNVATKYSVTFTIPSIAGKALGTGGNDWLCIHFWLSAGANFAARASAIGIQNATITITDVQLELGAVATAFERLPQQVQLAWCQRYFQRTDPNNGSAYILLGSASTATSVYGLYHYKVTMRAVPSLTTPGAVNLQVGDLVSAVTLTAISLSVAQCSKESALVQATVAGGLTTFRPYFLSALNTSGYLELSAEL